MSETRYPLRNRLTRIAVAAPTPGETPLSSTGTTNLESGVAQLPLTSISGLALEEEAATVHDEQNVPAEQIASPCLYSDVVATRLSSSAGQHDNTQLDVGISEICSAPTTPYLSSQVDQAFNDNSILFSSTQVMPENSPDKETNKPWTLVESKRAQRHHSLDTTEFSKGNSLTSEQEIVVKTAEQKLTAEEREIIGRCYEVVHFYSDGDKSLRGEGPSTGKGVDPGNWGALRFDPSILDV